MAKWMPLVLIAAVLATGCVERRVYLRSDPPGADVYIDGEYAGQTRPGGHPDGDLYASFMYYGRREFTFRMPGMATHTIDYRLEPPWYQYPPFDFFAELLVPYPIIDSHDVHARLIRAAPADVHGLYDAATEYRLSSRPMDRFEYAMRATIQQFDTLRTASRQQPTTP